MKTVTFNPLEFKLVPIELLNAVEHLLKCKGRFHTEQNFSALKSAHFDYSTMPEYPADTGWISVDERLPELHAFVLVAFNHKKCDVDFDVLIASYTNSYKGLKKVFVCGGDEMRINAITYWMPLPLPPEGSQK